MLEWDEVHFLRSLPRGDFLCEALHHWSANASSNGEPLVMISKSDQIDSKASIPSGSWRCRTFGRVNIISSRFLLSESVQNINKRNLTQMILVSEVCPDIEEMLFIYQDLFLSLFGFGMLVRCVTRRWSPLIFDSSFTKIPTTEISNQLGREVRHLTLNAQLLFLL